jgi:hypothetical protein
MTRTAADDWRLCERCGVAPGRSRDDDAGEYLCESCRRHAAQLGEAAIDLSTLLMRWAREQRWRGVDPEVLLQAVGLSFALFESRLVEGPDLGDVPQLLHACLDDGALQLTLASDPTSVWREEFGSLDSRHDRVPFLVLSETGPGPVDVTLHYWDKRERAALTLRFWTADDHVLDELFEASEGRRWGVPWNLVRVGGVREGSDAVEDLCAITGALGYFPVTGTRDAATGTATVEVAGDMTEVDREELLVTIASSLACDPGKVSIVPVLAPR